MTTQIVSVMLFTHKQEFVLSADVKQPEGMDMPEIFIFDNRIFVKSEEHQYTEAVTIMQIPDPVGIPPIMPIEVSERSH